MGLAGFNNRRRADAAKAAVPQGAETGDIPGKSDIAGMKRAELIEWLEAHGVDDPQGPVAELRDQLRAIMFMD